jgi:hypothetical protein
MRLINTGTFEFEEFMGAVPKYAILSHTWTEGEVTLQDWERARNSEAWLVKGAKALWSNGRTDAKRQLPIYHSPPADHSLFEDSVGAFNQQRPRYGYWKILKACFQARTDGLGYLWCDTNCIDKTSSAELSEAINSMYSWYRDSSRCYAYLEDVPMTTQATLCAEDSYLRSSRWFTRGWTLQELIAPLETVFFSREWTRLGTKSTLVQVISEITGVDEKYLLKMEGIHGASIAQRMSWAANRITTRPEDIAYCLLGIFNVNMPLIYGEGAKAFVRLQEEIIKTSDDHSIFAWTWVPELTDSIMRMKREGSFSSQDSDQDQERRTLSHTRHNFPAMRIHALRGSGLFTNPERPTLLAPDPVAFYDSGAMPTLAPTEDVAPFTINNAGLSISLPLIQQGPGDLTFAVLHRDQDKISGEGTMICIPLARHTIQKNRYTRTCFPRSPITISGQAPAGAASVSWARLKAQSIQVSRAKQEVPFYYNSFGGTSHCSGFWLFVPGGWNGWVLKDGYATPNGVFNSYGIFFHRPVERSPKSRWGGGLAVFSKGTKTVRNLAIFLAVALQHSDMHTGHESAARRFIRILDLGEQGWSVKGHNSADFGQLSLGKPGTLRELFDINTAHIDRHAELPQVTRSAGRQGAHQVLLHNSAPLSNAQDSDISVAELVFHV